MSAAWRRLLKRLHPEGIRWPGSLFYNALSASGIFRQHYRLLATDIAASGPVADLLDIGTGPGRLLLVLREALPEARLVGVDIAPAMVEQARRNLAGAGEPARIALCVAGAAALPFATESFDLVVSTGSLHHWKAASAGLDEVHRVLRPEGTALIYDLVRRLPAAEAARVRREFGRFRTSMLALHSFEEPFLEPGELLALARQSSFGGGEVGFVGALCRLRLCKRARRSGRQPGHH